jgi:hypothetical protein
MTQEAPDPVSDDLDHYMKAYVPTAVDPTAWALIADDATELVGRAGPMTRLRVSTDLSALASMVSHLVERGRPITMKEVLSLNSEATFDAHMHRRSIDSRHQQNLRSRLRRLRKVYAGGTHSKPRRSTEDRIAGLASHHLVEQLKRVIVEAHDSDDPNAADFLAAVDSARARRGTSATAERTFRRPDAWAFAADHGLPLTAPQLNSIIVQEVLRRTEPVAVLARTYNLSARDVEHGMTRALELPVVLTPESAFLLRG